MKKTITMVIIFSIIATVLLFVYKFFFVPKEERHKDIPKIYLVGDISNMNTKQDERKISIEYVSDDVNFKSNAKIKIQGSSSIYFEKKNYTINLYSDKNFEIKNKVNVGWGKQSKYCLKANWVDKTHARNIVTAEIASEISKKYDVLNGAPNNGVIDGFPIELYINDEFLGLYTWNIPKDAWLFGIDEDNENHLVFANEGWTDSSLFKESPNYTAFSIEVGRGNLDDLEKLNRLSEFIINSSDEEFKKNFDNYLDKDSTINYFIMLEFAELMDNYAKNMLLATYDGKVWYPTLYDLDSSWGTSYDGLSVLEYDNILNFTDSMLWEKVENNFSKEIAKRYFELREEILTTENIMKKFNNFKNSIPIETYKKEKNKWGDLRGFDISQIEKFLNVRIPLMDELMNSRL